METKTALKAALLAIGLTGATAAFSGQVLNEYGAYVAPTKKSESCGDRIIEGKEVSYVWRLGVCLPKVLLKTPEKFSVIHKIIREISPVENRELIHDFKLFYPPSEDYQHPLFMKDAFITEIVRIFGKTLKLRDGSTFEAGVEVHYWSGSDRPEILAFETLDGWYLCFKGNRFEADVVGKVPSYSLFREEVRYPSWSELVSRPICGG